MGTVTDSAGRDVPREHLIKIMIELGETPGNAEFIASMDADEIGGDIVVIDEKNQPFDYPKSKSFLTGINL